MLDHPKDERWREPGFEARLKQRLPGEQEYETYMATVSTILNVLEKIQKKLKISPDKVRSILGP